MQRVFLVSLVTFGLVCFSAADWPQFRGRDADGLCTSNVNGPATWTAEQNVIWKTDAPGFGASSPIMQDGKIYVTGYTGYGVDADNPGDIEDIRYQVACYDRKDGSVVWSTEIEPARSPETPYRGFSALHGYAAPTPVVDDKCVYAFFGNSGVYALNLENGEVLWRADAGQQTHGWNCGASLVQWNDLVIANASIESQSVIAFDKKTGDRVWSTGGIERSWATPLIVKVPGGQDELVVNQQAKAIGLDPATGEELWTCENVDDYVCPSVTAKDGVCYITGGRKPYFMAVRAGGRGDVTDSHILWKTERTPKVATPILVDGYLYFIDQRAKAVCMNAETGEVVYDEQLEIEGRGDKVYGSYVAMGGRLYCFSRVGGCVVVPAAPNFELSALNSLGDDSVFNATPIVDDGQIIIRSDKRLYCIGAK